MAQITFLPPSSVTLDRFGTCLNFPLWKMRYKCLSVHLASEIPGRNVKSYFMVSPLSKEGCGEVGVGVGTRLAPVQSRRVGGDHTFALGLAEMSALRVPLCDRNGYTGN